MSRTKFRVRYKLLNAHIIGQGEKRMAKQLYNKGDYVRVAKDLGSSMSHFTSDCDAVIRYSYNDRYGGSGNPQYSIYIKGVGSTAWYYEHQLTLVESNRLDLLNIWEKEAQDFENKVSDLDWIFDNGKDVLKSSHGASVQALADCFGLTNLWGGRGEGIDYYNNSYQTIHLAKPFLEDNDKDGWLEYCKNITTTLVRDDCINRPLKIQHET